jgi:hypothetical protein
MKTIYVLIGPPSVGKSTWIKNNLSEKNPYIINRDELVEKVAEEIGLTYDDLFVTPPAGSKLGDVSDKYGTVVESPSNMTWSPLSYDKILDANGKVANLFGRKLSGAKGEDNIVVDMTNMNAGSRKSALNAIKGLEDEYKKIAVVFKFKGSEDLIKQVAQKRAEEAKKIGKSKTIPDTAFDRMFQSYQEVTSDEGFDEVIEVDNTSTLKSVLEVKENVKWVKSFNNFRRS